MATKVVETERKYEAGGRAVLPELGELPAVAAQLGPDELVLDAQYFDTEDLRLLHAGVTLRRRTGGDDAGWHLKLPVGPDSREEIRVPLGRATRKVPGELRRLVQVHTRGRPLDPVAQLKTVRQRWHLVDTDGRVLAEVVLDAVSAQRLGAAAATWSEIEVELVNGEPDLLEAIDRRFTAAGLRRGKSPSKLAKLFGDAATGKSTGKPVRLNGKTPAVEVVLAYLREQAEAIKHNDLLVRQDEPDSVHQLRVATRRLRSGLQAYCKVIERDRTRALTDELKWLASELGKARDAEVLHQRIIDHIDATPDELVLGPVRARVHSHYSREAAQARTTLLEALDGQRYVAILDDLDTLLADPPRTDLAGKRAKTVLPKLVKRSYRRLAKAVERVERAEDAQQRDLSLHEARKAAKRARYAAEAVTPAFGKPAGKLAKRMKQLQSLLGEHQDSIMSREALRAFGVQAQLSGENGFSYGLFHGEEACRAAQARRELPSAWGRASKAKYRRWLAG